MAIAQLLLLASSAFAAELPQIDGTISGTVLNRSGDRARPCQATVMLLVLSDGQFVPFRETTADAQGKFRFDGLPVGDAYRYRAGANQDGVHFPGPRVSLTATRPSVALELTVYDASPRPCPLVIRQYEITLCPEPGMLRVTESMVVDNPSSTCYVGMAAEEDVGPVTLELAVPGDFERVTFQEEFYGRQFAMTAGKLATRIPWPPGRRELKFTYVLRSTESYRVWERPLDLPSSNVRVQVAQSEAGGGDLQSPLNFCPGGRRSGLPVRRARPARWAGDSRRIGTLARPLDNARALVGRGDSGLPGRCCGRSRDIWPEPGRPSSPQGREAAERLWQIPKIHPWSGDGNAVWRSVFKHRSGRRGPPQVLYLKVDGMAARSRSGGGVGQQIAIFPALGPPYAPWVAWRVR